MTRQERPTTAELSQRVTDLTRQINAHLNRTPPDVTWHVTVSATVTWQAVTGGCAGGTIPAPKAQGADTP
ncbi:hypothetical protein SRB5_43560 [Streptomyces sp. RB5]|uniref:Uncharacterized protein n=1 Tax=Streptomyces smaragdinus TaxID=2585196 RepID=A0A7K0CN45_9ACTN|nr:hypothetical protein [Streptomyces smaragdinus]